jgi:hypothetical protein
MSTLEEIANRDPWTLAPAADAAGPDRIDSPGAKYLESVRDAVIEWWEDIEPEYRDGITEEDAQEAAGEQVDAAVPVFNHERMMAMVDLAAYHEEISDFGEAEDLLQAAGWALYMVGERLFVALARELIEARDEEDDSDA